MGGSTKVDVIVKKLEEYRTRNNVPKREMAAIIGVSKTTYYDWLNGKTVKKISVLERIQQILEEENNGAKASNVSSNF